MSSWAQKHSGCVVCGTSASPHLAKGMCNKCYKSAWIKSSPTVNSKSHKKPLVSNKELRSMYLEEHLSTNEIARRKECTSTTIKNYLKRYGIEARGLKLTDAEYFKKCHEVWGDIYDFSKSRYRGAKNPVYIICTQPGHGGFWASNADNFRRKKSRCPKCSTRHPLTKERFLALANSIHGDRYNYERVENVSYSSKIEINCDIHGSFEQNVGSHLSGCGCPKCANKDKGKALVSTHESVIESFRAVHGDYYIYENVDYSNNNTKVEIICPRHGSFFQLPSNHISGKGCKVCGRERQVENHKNSKEWFIVEAQKVFGDSYDYSKVHYVAMKELVTLACPKHGLFEKSPDHHLRGQGCPGCATYGFDQTKPATVYYLRVERPDDSPVYKIGITNRLIEERWNNKEDRSRITVVESWNYESGRDAYNFEQRILRLHYENKYFGDPILESGNTELFISDILELDSI